MRMAEPALLALQTVDPRGAISELSTHFTAADASKMLLYDFASSARNAVRARGGGAPACEIEHRHARRGSRHAAGTGTELASQARPAAFASDARAPAGRRPTRAVVGARLAPVAPDFAPPPPAGHSRSAAIAAAAQLSLPPLAQRVPAIGGAVPSPRGSPRRTPRARRGARRGGAPAALRKPAAPSPRLRPQYERTARWRLEPVKRRRRRRRRAAAAGSPPCARLWDRRRRRRRRRQQRRRRRQQQR